MAGEVAQRDGVDLQLRVGLNSGQVIAGEIGSGTLGYTAIGEQVGMAQRMESAAPPGGVMLSESTARLVEDTAVLAEPELVYLKGATNPVQARRLIATTKDHRDAATPGWSGAPGNSTPSPALLDEAISGAGCVIGVLGPPGIGKSRIVREAAALASSRSAKVFTTYCESHTSDIPFHAVTGLLRAGLGVDCLDAEAARAQFRRPISVPTRKICCCWMTCSASPTRPKVPNIEADARRRRLTALVNAASVARREPALYVIEDAHPIDDGQRVDAG